MLWVCACVCVCARACACFPLTLPASAAYLPEHGSLTQSVESLLANQLQQLWLQALFEFTGWTKTHIQQNVSSSYIRIHFVMKKLYKLIPTANKSLKVKSHISPSVFFVSFILMRNQVGVATSADSKPNPHGYDSSTLLHSVFSDKQSHYEQQYGC